MSDEIEKAREAAAAFGIDFDAILEKAAAIEAAHAPAAAEAERNRDRARRAANLRGVPIPIEEHVPRQIIDGALERTPVLEAVAGVVSAMRNGYAPKKILALLGPPGRGKTTAGGFAIGELGGAYAKFEDLVELRRSRTKGDRIEYRRLLGARVLVVDELGLEAERLDERVDARLTFHDVIDARVSIRGLLVLLSNLSELELRDRFDERTFDRLGALWEVVEDQDRDSFRQRRPWRIALGHREGSRDVALQVPSPIPKVSKDAARRLRAKLTARFHELREYHVAKDSRVESRVELSGAYYEALLELRASEAA
jgi:DNA replication protein DnaC